MATPKKKPDKKTTKSRHRWPGMQLRLHPKMRSALDKLVEQNASDKTEEIRAAIRSYLQAHGLWPTGEGCDKPTE